MPILSEITFINIIQPNLVTEIHGPDIDTGKEIRLRAEEPQNQVYYVREPNTGENVIIQKIKAGSNNTDCFFAEDKTDPTKNLLVEMEKNLTGEPDSP